MAADTLVSVGPNYWELTTPAVSLLVTPNGGAQTTLGSWMASPVIVGLLQESAMDGIVAHAGGGQAAATAMTLELNRVATVATSGDSVRLPASMPGLTIIVENAGANPMQVFGYGTDTINNALTAVGVSHMQGSVVIYSCYSAGAWFANGLGAGYAGSFATSSSRTGITAQAAGGQPAAGSAYVLPAMVNNVTTVGAANASLLLPPNQVGMQITVANNGANALSVYADSGSTMNGTANGSASVAVGSITIFYCMASGVWMTK